MIEIKRAIAIKWRALDKQEKDIQNESHYSKEVIKKHVDKIRQEKESLEECEAILSMYR